MLTKDQKENLKSLIMHPGWQLVKKLELEAREALWTQFENADITDDKVAKILRENQLYMKARKDFVLAIENQTMDIFAPNIENLTKL